MERRQLVKRLLRRFHRIIIGLYGWGDIERLASKLLRNVLIVQVCYLALQRKDLLE